MSARLRGRTWIVATLVVVVATASQVVAASAHASNPAPRTTPTWSLGAWLYPSPTGGSECTVAPALRAGRFRTLSVKVEYLDVSSQGTVVTNVATQPAYACNGYSPANAAALRAGSASQFVTVSLGSLTAERNLTGNAAHSAASIQKMSSFVKQIGFTGIDIDFENFWTWTASDAARYYGYLGSLAVALHTLGLQLEVDGPADLDTRFNYGTVLATGVDRVVMMDYDFQDPSPRESTCPPITPLAWLAAQVRGGLAEIPVAERGRLVVGLPAYGYVGSNRCQHIVGNVFFQRMRTEPGFSNSPAVTAGRRDKASGEIRWHAGGRFFDYVDQVAMDEKLAVVQHVGVRAVSVWVLGGDNPWFSAAALAG